MHAEGAALPEQTGGGEKMHLSYEKPIDNERTQEVSDKLLSVLVERCATYREAMDSLTLAQEKLLEQTRPISTRAPHSGDCTGTS